MRVLRRDLQSNALNGSLPSQLLQLKAIQFMCVDFIVYSDLCFIGLAPPCPQKPSIQPAEWDGAHWHRSAHHTYQFVSVVVVGTPLLRVLMLPRNLSSNVLNGTIPWSLGQLTALQAMWHSLFL
jgi:hypothetical protein